MPLNFDARNWSELWVVTNLAPADEDALVDGDEVLAAPLVDDFAASDEEGLDAAGGVALGLDKDGLEDGLGDDDWAIAPDSAKALSATPNKSLFNILASKR
jgi:hypothetical protein